MKIRMLVEAQAEAVEAADWYDQKRSGLGDEFLAEVQVALLQIEQHPLSFSRWEPFDGPGEIRRAAVRRFPYNAIFLVHHHELVVVAVAHHRRQPLYWVGRIS